LLLLLKYEHPLSVLYSRESYWGGGCDVDHPMNTKYPLHVPNKLITRSKVKALKEALNGLVVQVSAKAKIRDPLEHKKEALIHLILVQKGLNPPLFGLWSFDNKVANFISISANLVM